MFAVNSYRTIIVLCAPFQFEVGDIRPDVGCFAELPHLQVIHIYYLRTLLID